MSMSSRLRQEEVNPSFPTVAQDKSPALAAWFTLIGSLKLSRR